MLQVKCFLLLMLAATAMFALPGAAKKIQEEEPFDTLQDGDSLIDEENTLVPTKDGEEQDEGLNQLHSSVSSKSGWWWHRHRPHHHHRHHHRHRPWYTGLQAKVADKALFTKALKQTASLEASKKQRYWFTPSLQAFAYAVYEHPDHPYWVRDNIYYPKTKLPGQKGFVEVYEPPFSNGVWNEFFDSNAGSVLNRFRAVQSGDRITLHKVATINDYAATVVAGKARTVVMIEMLIYMDGAGMREASATRGGMTDYFAFLNKHYVGKGKPIQSLSSGVSPDHAGMKADVGCFTTVQNQRLKTPLANYLYKATAQGIFNLMKAAYVMKSGSGGMCPKKGFFGSDQ